MGDTLVAHKAAIPCDCHLIHQLDAGHFGAVAVPMAGLQDACVSAGARSEPRPDLSEQFIVDCPLLHMTTGETSVVESAGAGLRDQLLDEWTKLLRSCFRRLDRATLDQRRRETAHQRELLLGRAL